jgi:hypothetical protein
MRSCEPRKRAHSLQLAAGIFNHLPAIRKNSKNAAAEAGLPDGKCVPTKKGRDTVIPAFLTWLLQVPLVS